MRQDLPMSDPVPRVLLDTSVIVEAGYGRSGPFEHLLRDAADQRVQVIVPEVVLAETGFVYRGELQHMRGRSRTSRGCWRPPVTGASSYGPGL
jgi:rRNA-processing protein FCF1